MKRYKSNKQALKRKRQIAKLLKMNETAKAERLQRESEYRSVDWKSEQDRLRHLDYILATDD